MENIDKILEELFEFEPELRAHESQVRQAVLALLQSKPVVKIDPVFAKELKAKLLVQASAGKFGLSSFLAWLRQPALAYGLAGLTVVILAVSSFYAGEKKGEHIAGVTGQSQQNVGKNSEGPNPVASIQDLQKPIVNNIKKFGSKEEFLAYLEQAQGATVAYGRGGGPVALEAPMASDGMGMVQRSMNAPTTGEVIQRVSDTNVQVAGIDEPDIVKTDGKNLFISLQAPYYYGYYEEKTIDVPATGSMPIRPPQSTASTKVVGALPASDMKVLSKIDKQGDVLLSGNVLMVFDYRGVWAYDVQDKANPKDLWQIKYEQNGQLSAARLYNGRLYLVTQNYVNYGDPCPIRPLSIGKTTIEVPCRDIYHPIAPVNDSAVYHAFAVDPASGLVKDRISFVGSGGSAVVYMSENNLYITYNYNADQIKLTIDFLKTNGAGILPDEVLSRLEKLDNYDIGGNAKMVEMQNIIQKYMGSLSQDDQRQKENDLTNRMADYLKANKRSLYFTGIAKIGLGGFDIAATGKVPGQLLNQFALDEYQGNLRLAVTVGGQGGGLWGGWNSQDSANDVYVLDKNLNQVGSVQDLGLTERVYSARFIGDKAYLVTFRQTDPFYVLDLSKPKDPKLKGELKIPGYSSYLHPLTDTLLLGVGQENGKVKLSLFDVSDASSPKEIDKYTLDEYWTEAANNHHAFLQDKDHQVFFLPGGQSGYVFSYSGSRLKMQRAVTGLAAKRAVYIGNTLYIIGDSQIVAVDETSWNRIGELNF